MISHIVHYIWEKDGVNGAGRSFIGFDFEPSSEDIVECEKRLSEEMGQRTIIVGLSRIANNRGAK